MLPITLLVLIMFFILIKDLDIKNLLLVVALFFCSDYLMWMSSSQYYYERHIISDLVLTGAFIHIGIVTGYRANYMWAGAICAVSAFTMIFEYTHEYQSIIYPYLQTIQYILLQLMIFALTYKAEWRKWCPEKRRLL